MNDVYIIESWLGEVQQLWSTGIQLLMRGLDGVRVDVVGWGAGDRGPGAARRASSRRALSGLPETTSGFSAAG